MITFEAFVNKLFTARTDDGEQLRVYAFDNEDCTDNFVRSGGRNSEGLVFVHSSDLKPHVTLRDEWCKAEVVQIYAVDVDMFAVLLYTGEET